MKKSCKNIKENMYLRGTLKMLKTRKLNALIAIEIIISMTFYYFLLVGSAAVTYAIDVVQTNNHNIDFSAYFIDENGEKQESIKREVDKTEILYVDVSVKNEGYFNGEISFENSNFIVLEEILSDNIISISNNKVSLKQINAGKTETIKMKIKVIDEDKISKNLLNEPTKIVLKGNYINSKNIEDTIGTNINGNTHVQIFWESSKNIVSNLSSDILTNYIYNMEGTSKRVVQLLVKSKVSNNEYPINSTTIKMNTPENAENVKVFARSTSSTNKFMEFSNENYVYDSENKTLTIKLENGKENDISWVKNVEDTFIVTYILPEEQDVSNEKIEINSEIITLDGKSLTGKSEIVLNKNIDGIVTNDLKTKEEFIYKGKIYSGEEREYYTASTIYVNYSDLINNIILKEEASNYLVNENEIQSNILYKGIIVNKNSFENILGKDGYINIKNEQGNVIGNINSSLTTDENGNYVINYTSNTKYLTIETSKPIKEGTLNIVNKKTIAKEELSREDINSLNKIRETIVTSYNANSGITKAVKDVELKETSTKASLEVSTNTLKAIETNKDIKIKIVLENNTENRDLYQNPTIKLKFPKQVSKISILDTSKLIYGNDLKIESANIEKVDENFVLNVSLAGTQTKYNPGLVEGTTILLNSNIDIDENAVNSNEQFVLNYSNELAKNYEDNGQEVVDVKIEEIPEEIKIQREQERIAKEKAEQEKNNQMNKLKASNLATNDSISASIKAYVGGNEIKDGDTVHAGEIVRYEVMVENITDNELKNIKVGMTIPENAKFVKYIRNTGVTEDETGIHSAVDEYKEETDNSIVIESLNAKETKTILFEAMILNNTVSNNLENTLKISVNGSEITKTMTNVIENSEVALRMYRTMRTDEKIIKGEQYDYFLDVENISNSDLSNVNIEFITNSIYHVERIKDEDTETEINTDTDSFEISKLGKNETKRYRIKVLAVNNDENAVIAARAMGKYFSNNIIEVVGKYEIEATLTSPTQGEKVNDKDNIVYNIQVKNTGNETINILQFEQEISEYVDINAVKANGKELEITNNEEDEGAYKINYTYEEKIQVNETINIEVNATVNNPTKHNIENISTYVNISNSYKEKTLDSISHVLDGYKEAETPQVTIGEITSEPIYTKDTEKDTDNTEKDNDDKPKDDSGNTNPKEDDNTGNKDNENKDSDNKDSDNKNTDNDKENETKTNKYKISGVAWLDSNENGKRETNESKLANVTVKLINTSNENIVSEVKTNNNGEYVFSNLENGKYMVIFEFDTGKYMLAQYQVAGVDSTENSDVENPEIKLNGQVEKVYGTDTLEIKDSDIANIDLGLVNAKKFDLALTKTINKVTISNTEGNKVKEYNDVNSIKEEIGAKYVSGSLVVIEYKIKVKNVGEIAGYANEIVDNKPSDLNFNSKLNANWYQSGDKVYSKAFENVKIEPGEEKEIKLILTKTMTETNLGLTNNTAEILKSDNSQSIADENSENDKSYANVIIGVKTGAAVTYISITFIIVFAIAIGTYFVSKKILMKKEF